MKPLSVNEQRQLELAAQGLTQRAAAELCGLSPYTVSDHRQAACDKLGARNITHAVALAIRQGIL